MKSSHKMAAAAAAGALATSAALSPSVINLSVQMFNHWEGRNYTAVHLPFDPRGVVTVCGGVTNQDLPWLKAGMRFTEPECLKIIGSLIPKYAAPIMKCVPTFTKMPDHRQAALISFAINLGPGKVCGTSISRDLNTGRPAQACNAMTRYIAANGKRLQGLVNRRNDPVWGEKPWCMMAKAMPWWQRWARAILFRNT